MGGEITREVHGIPDESFNGYCGPNRIGAKTSGSLDNNFMKNVANGSWDSEPDKFYFSFLGFSGSFVLDSDGNPLLQSNQTGVKIIYCPIKVTNQQSPSKFILLDQNGNQYFFEIPTTTICQIHGAVKNNYQTYISSWSISKIITAGNQEIDFTYSSYSSGAYITYTEYNNVRRVDYGLDPVKNCLGNKHTPDTTYNENIDISFQPNYLVAISGSGVTINLGYNLLRSDLPNSRALTDLSVIYNNASPNAFTFNYGYFTSNDGTNTQRLKLNSISQVFAGGQIKNPYTFYYNETVNLPARNSIKTDYLGYYNNNSQSSNIGKYADKTPYLANSQANILQRVKKIFGGSLNFEYELNDYYHNINDIKVIVPGLRIRRIYETIDDFNLTPVNQSIFNYNIFNTNSSSGQLFTSASSLIYFINIQCETSSNCGEEFDSSEPLASLTDLNGSPIGYSNVTVTRLDGSFAQYTYTNYLDYPDLSVYSKWYYYYQNPSFNVSNQSPVFQYLNTPRTSYAFARGKLLEEDLMNSNGQLVKKTTNTYSLTPSVGQVIGIYTTVNSFDQTGTNYDWTGYIYFNQDLQLLSKTVQNYISGVAQQSISENYTYTNYAPNLIRTKSVILSGGKTDKYTFRYPFDVIPSIPTTPPATTSVLNTMVYNNIISKPVEAVHTVIKNSIEQVVSANVTQFSNTISGIRPYQEFNFQSRFPILLSSYVNYNVTVNNGIETNNLDTRIKSASIYKVYDANGNLLQVESPSNTGNYASSIYGYNKMFKTADVTNASQADIAYTGFESTDLGNWSYIGTSIFDINAITGTFNYNLSKGSISKTGLTTTKTYVLTYWTKNSTYFTVTGTQGTPKLLATHNSWNLYQHIVSGKSTISISGNGLIDELRLFPLGSKMITYAYNPYVGLINKIDENNQITYYNYDEYNRLQYVRDNEKNIISATCYNYAGEPGECFLSYSSAPKSGSFYKNDCGPGYGSNAVTYTVEAGRYTAGSQVAADGLAQNDVNQNGQNYANANGVCVQQTIYARIELSNYSYPQTYTDQYNYTDFTYADVNIKLYADINCTIPFILTTSLNVIVAEGYNYSTVYNGSGSTVTNTTFTIPSGASSYYLGNVVISDYNTYTDPYTGTGSDTDTFNYTYSTAANSNYYLSLTTKL